MSKADDSRKIIEQDRVDRLGREKSERNREGFFGQHQLQKNTALNQADRLDNFEAGGSIILNSMSRLRVYVSLTDMNLSPFINDAKSKARAAYLTGTRNWHYQYDIDVAHIDVKLRGRAVHIKITPNDKFYFEFATSGKPVITETFVQGALSFPAYKGCMVGVNVSIKDGLLFAKPTILKYKRDAYGQNLSRVERGYQIQLINEPVAYPRAEVRLGRTRTLHTLFESYSPTYSWTGVLDRCTDGPWNTFAQPTACGPAGTLSARDIGFDVPYQDGEKAKPIRTAYIRGAADWPSANGKQVVKNKNYGDREFVIYIDAFNQFAIFPSAMIGPLGAGTGDAYAQNVPEGYIQRITPALPAWVYKATQKTSDYWAVTPDFSKLVLDIAQIDWKFNHLGTKCCAITMEREEYKFDTAFWAINPSATQPFTSAKFSAFKSYMGLFSNFTTTFSQYTYQPQRWFVAPGIVELTIEITLTGPDLMQFTAAITAEEVRRPSLTSGANSRYSLLVGYTWFDIPKAKNTSKAVKAGTMVSIDMELWVQPRGTKGELTNRQILMSVQDVRAAAELYSIVGSPILGVDLTTLSLVHRIDAYSVEQKTCSGVEVPFVVRHSGACIIHSGVVKDVLFPETMPDDMKLVAQRYIDIGGRKFLADRIAATTTDGAWELVPMTHPKDGWGDSSLNQYRDYWAHDKWYDIDQYYALIDPDINVSGYVQYKTASPPAYPADGDATEKWLAAIGGDFRILFFCDSPRWGWHQYTSTVVGYLNVNLHNTFFTHPNGTYAFFDNGWIYDKNGMPGDFVALTGPGSQTPYTGVSSWNKDTLATYDITKLEHVIFDRIHFEVSVKDRKAVSRNTSFRELYNNAIKLDINSIPPAENINPIELVDMRATFIKEIGTNGHSFLDLKATWNGRNGWYQEEAYSTGTTTTYPPLYGTAGNFNNLNLYGYWRTTNYAGGGVAKPLGSTPNDLPSGWHATFANPLLVMEK